MPRSWDQLSDAYRNRLIRKGVTREYYESGGSVTAERGHARTPEHPERIDRNPERYPEYIASRERVYAHVRRVLLEAISSGLIDRLDLGRVRQMIFNANGYVLRTMRNITFPELQEKASYQVPRSLRYKYRERYRSTRKDGLAPMPWFVLVDGKWMNPFWYH